MQQLLWNITMISKGARSSAVGQTGNHHRPTTNGNSVAFIRDEAQLTKSCLHARDMVLCECYKETSEDFEVKTGVRQGCVLSRLLFNCFMDTILREAKETTGGGLHIKYTTTCSWDKTSLITCIKKIQYADDLTIVAENRKELQQMLDALNRACTWWGIRTSGDKTTQETTQPLHWKVRHLRKWTPSLSWEVR